MNTRGHMTLTPTTSTSFTSNTTDSQRASNYKHDLPLSVAPLQFPQKTQSATLTALLKRDLFRSAVPHHPRKQLMPMLSDQFEVQNRRKIWTRSDCPWRWRWNKTEAHRNDGDQMATEEMKTILGSWGSLGGKKN